MSQSQSLLHADPSSELRTRDRELADIANSIGALAELFKDLSVLVIDQGTLLDSVEYNIEQTAVHMEDAVKDLTVATGYAVSSPRTNVRSRYSQVPEEHRPAQVHLSTATHHRRPHPRPHLQAQKAFFGPTARPVRDARAGPAPVAEICTPQTATDMTPLSLYPRNNYYWLYIHIK